MELNIVSSGGKADAATVTVSDAAFDAPYNEPLIHQVVTAYLAGARSGTKAQKSRSEVRGGGTKPFRQKGLGRARAGTIRSPIWRGGGATFAAKPRDYSQKVNRKMYRGAMRSILSELVRKERLVVVDEFSAERPGTKDMVTRLEGMNLNDVLIVTAGDDLNLELSVRNLHWVAVVPARDVNPATLLAFEKVLVTEAALKSIEGRLS